MHGTTVDHSRYGPGVVQQSRYQGLELSVQFPDGMTRWVRLDELKDVGVPTRASATSAIITPLGQSDEALRSRRMVEAFRMGIVPYDCINDFIFGRQREMDKLTDWLVSPKENSLVLMGEYGSGKTHLLEYAYWRAMQEGYAVARADIDQNEVPFHKPKRVYSHLVRSFRYLSDESGRKIMGFRDFVKEALSQGAFKDHPYLSRLIGRTSDEALWDWIEARDPNNRPVWVDYFPKLPGLYSASTAANIYCHLLSALGWAAKEVLKLRGLAVFIDEAEAVDRCYYGYQIENSYNFLKGLVWTAADEPRLLRPDHSLGLRYYGGAYTDGIPYLYKQPCGLKLLFAFTPTYSVETIYDELPIPLKIDLEPLADRAVKDVFEHICLLYDSAHQFLQQDTVLDALYKHVIAKRSGGPTRMFVKGSVEALDLLRFNPDRTLGEVLR